MKKIIILVISLFILFSCNSEEKGKIDKKINIETKKEAEIVKKELELPSDFNSNKIKSYFENKEIVKGICLDKNTYFEKYGNQAIIELCKKFEDYNNKKYLTKNYYISFNSDLVINKEKKEKHIFLKYDLLMIQFNFINGKNIKIKDFKYDGKILKKGENKFIFFPKVSKEGNLFFPNLEFDGIKYNFGNIEQYSYLGEIEEIKKDKEISFLVCRDREKYIDKVGEFLINNLCDKQEKLKNKKLEKSDIDIDYGCEFYKKINGKKVCFFDKNRDSGAIYLEINKKFNIKVKDFIFDKKYLFGGNIYIDKNYLGGNHFTLELAVTPEGKKYFPKFTLKGIKFEFNYDEIYNKENNILVYNKICGDKEKLEIYNERTKYRGAYDGEKVKFFYNENGNYIKDFCEKNIEFKK